MIKLYSLIFCALSADLVSRLPAVACGTFHNISALVFVFVLPGPRQQDLVVCNACFSFPGPKTWGQCIYPVEQKVVDSNGHMRTASSDLAFDRPLSCRGAVCEVAVAGCEHASGEESACFAQQHDHRREDQPA